MNEADVILFVVDGKNGLNPLDEEVAYLLRKRKNLLSFVLIKLIISKLNKTMFMISGD